MNYIEKIFKAAIYVRLSKEDGDSFLLRKNESDSITNQKLLIMNHLKKMPGIEVTEIFEDDGFTGTNFERPGFQRLIEAIKEQRIDCVVVKDFSRLGREYLGAGNYIEKIFPALGVRFISINDDYDSLHSRGQTDNLIVPFKNLLNEQYSRDTSGKIRSALGVKRKQGLFVSNFSVYGYQKDPENKNHLIVDEYAAAVVRDIFKMKIDGLSMAAIAERLNKRKLLAPADYKRDSGIRYRTSFKTRPYSGWSATAISRILRNEVYCGNLIQGKRRKKSYKVNVQEFVKPEERDRIENTHEAIINSVLFQEVQRLLREDTRIGGGNTIYALAGKIFCKDCGGAMVRKTVSSNGKKYAYYVCGNYKQNSKWCSPHQISTEKLEAAVLFSVQAQISVMLDMDRALEGIDHLVWEQREVKKLSAQIETLDIQIAQNKQLRMEVYEDLKSGLIDRSEYESLRSGFSEKAVYAQEAKDRLLEEQNTLVMGLNDQQQFLSGFRKYENIQELNRNVVVALIDKVLVEDGKNIKVEFRYQDRFASIDEFLESQNRGIKRSESYDVGLEGSRQNVPEIYLSAPQSIQENPLAMQAASPQ